MSATGCLQETLPYPNDVLSLYTSLRHLPLPIWLSSGDNPSLAGRYDILSAAPERQLRTEGKWTTISHADGRRETSDRPPFELLKEAFQEAMPEQVPETFGELPFPGGALGHFAYELLHPWYGITPDVDDDIGLPAMLVGIYHWALIVDHRESCCHLVVLPGCPPSLVEEVRQCLKRTQPPSSGKMFHLLGDFRSNFSAAGYQDAFQRVIDYIHAGDCYQVNLSQRFSAPYEGDTLQAFAHLHALANAPFSAYLEDGCNAILSFSPERFIQNEGREVMTQPIKGTRPRHWDPARDRALLDELLASEKDRAENLMIVDLLRNDLGQVCATGTVSVPKLFEAQSFNNVHHLVSTISGRLKRPEDIFDLFGASFPGGSITGAPKIRSMEIINELETRPRSVYCGSIAYFGFNGRMDSNICIRTLVCADGQVHCWGGGGVVADSLGPREYQETFDKISLFIDNLPFRPEPDPLS